MGLLDRLQAWLGGGRREVSVVVLGLDNSGKSSVLRALAAPATPGSGSGSGSGPGSVLGEPPPPPPPTVGAKQDSFHSGGVTFCAWDVGGGRRHRALWERHYRAADAIVYVVDAADRLRLVVSREELALVLAHPEVSARRVPLLVLANKSDRHDALAPTQVAQALALERIADIPWHICATSATTGAGLSDGVAWLAREIRH